MAQLYIQLKWFIHRLFAITLECDLNIWVSPYRLIIAHSTKQLIQNILLL